MTTHHNLTDKEIKDREEDAAAAAAEQPNSGVESLLPAMQDTATTIPASIEKLKVKKGKKGKKNKTKENKAYQGLNKYRPDMICSSCGRPMTQTGAITTEEIAITKRLLPKPDGKPPFKPLPSVGANRGLAVVCDDCIRQSRPPEEGGTNMPITYKTVVVMTQAGKIVNVPISSIK